MTDPALVYKTILLLNEFVSKIYNKIAFSMMDEYSDDCVNEFINDIKEHYNYKPYGKILSLRLFSNGDCSIIIKGKNGYDTDLMILFKDINRYAYD